MKNKLIYIVDRLIGFIDTIGTMFFISCAVLVIGYITKIEWIKSLAVLVGIGSSIILVISLVLYYDYTKGDNYRRNYFNQGYVKRDQELREYFKNKIKENEKDV